MPQLRKDPLTNRWVVVNYEVPKKAAAYPQGSVREKSSKACPFCPGNEAMTPPEIALYSKKIATQKAPAPSPWQVRVIPNKFPALRIEEKLEKNANGVYDKLGGFGAHEVIIENPDHDKEIADLNVEDVALILKVYRDRCLDLKKDARFKYILIFKNYGAAAGASLEHPHSQLIGLPIVPSRVKGEVKGASRHHEFTERCIFCDMLDQEREEHKLSIHEEAGYVAMAPFASRFPFETWILPQKHEASFDAITDDGILGLANVLKSTLLRIKKALKDPAYNFMIHTLPINEKSHETFHWHIEIIPHLTQVAGFELGTGFYLNPTPPETAARALKDTPLD